MPWKLENPTRNIVKYFLPNHSYTIGRAAADFIVIDKSVSRKHATFSCQNESNYISVEDLSKFGTFINNNPLRERRGRLSDGDSVTFGAQPGVEFRCSFETLVVMASVLVSDDKNELKRCLMECGGGSVVECWDSRVQYLVMSNLRVTYKVVCSLIKQTKIVNVNFIKELLDYFKGIRHEIPQYDEYLPEVKETDLSISTSSFKPNPNREILFKNKKFYFLTNEKLTKLEEAIRSASGQIILLTELNYNDKFLKTNFSDPDNIVMYEAVQNSLVKQVYAMLKSIRRRPIIDSEIGYAVLHVSTDDFCNPTKSCNKIIYPNVDLSDILTISPVEEYSRDRVVSKARCEKRKHSDDKSDLGSVSRVKSICLSEPKDQSIAFLSQSISFTQGKENRKDSINVDTSKISSSNQNTFDTNNRLKMKNKSSNYGKENRKEQIINDTPEISSSNQNTFHANILLETEIHNNQLSNVGSDSKLVKRNSTLTEIVNKPLTTNQTSTMQSCLDLNTVQEEDEFDNIPVPSFGIIPTNINRVPNNCFEKPPIENCSIQGTITRTSEIKKTVDENQVIRDNNIEIFSTEIIRKWPEDREICPIDNVVRFVSLIKEKYSPNFCHKKFKKASNIYLAEHPIQMYPYRK